MLVICLHLSISIVINIIIIIVLNKLNNELKNSHRRVAFALKEKYRGVFCWHSERRCFRASNKMECLEREPNRCVISTDWLTDWLPWNGVFRTPGLRCSGWENCWSAWRTSCSPRLRLLLLSFFPPHCVSFNEQRKEKKHLFISRRKRKGKRKDCCCLR